MRTLLIILFLSAAGAFMNGDLNYAEQMPVAVNCSKKHNMPLEFTKMDFTKKDFGTELIKHSDELKRLCIAGCIYKQMTVEKLIKSITEGESSSITKELTENIQKCFKTNKNDDCEFMKCLFPVVFGAAFKKINEEFDEKFDGTRT